MGPNSGEGLRRPLRIDAIGSPSSKLRSGDRRRVRDVTLGLLNKLPRRPERPVRVLFAMRSSSVGREHINGEDAGNSRLGFDSPLAIADACIVDYGVKATDLVNLVGNVPHPGDG